MENTCKICNKLFGNQSKLIEHEKTMYHKDALIKNMIDREEAFQKKLEEANLETLKEKELLIQREQKLEEANADKERAILREQALKQEMVKASLEKEKERKLAIQREQKLKQENIAIEAKFLKEKREREDIQINSTKERISFQGKLKELELMVETQSFKRLSRKDFEKRSTQSLNSTNFKSNFFYSSDKVYDSSIDDHLSESQKETIVEYGIKITDKKQKEQINLNIMKIDPLNTLLIGKSKAEYNNSDYIEVIPNKEDIREKIIVERRNENDLSDAENKDTYELSYLKDIEEESKKFLLRYRLNFLDFEDNRSLRIRNTRLFIIIKKNDTQYDEIFKYMCYLKKHKSCDIKFYEEQSLYFLSYEPTIQQNYFYKTDFYLPDIKIDNNKILIAKIHKKKLKPFMKLFKPFESSISDSVTSDFIGKIFKNGDKTDKETLKSTEILLNESLKSFGITYINEYGCAVGMVPILLGFSKYNISDNLKNEIYSLEKYMRVNGKSRACDAIYRYGNVLFIIEYKMNIHHEQHALEYIGDRDYVKHVLKYLLTNENDVLDEIDTIGQIGILFYKDHVEIELGENLSIDKIRNEIGLIIPNEKIAKKKLKQKY
jgi:hypothetical protein